MNRDTKIVKVICKILAVVSAFMLFGYVGGLENEFIGMSDFIIRVAICLATLGVSVYVNHRMTLIEYERCKVWDKKKTLKIRSKSI